MLIGEEIQCNDVIEMVLKAEELVQRGYGVSLLYGKKIIRVISVPEGEHDDKE